MRKLVFILTLLVSAPVLADCYAVNDPDQRAYCRAKTQQDRSICYSIQKADLRAMCLAEVPR